MAAFAARVSASGVSPDDADDDEGAACGSGGATVGCCSRHVLLMTHN